MYTWVHVCVKEGEREGGWFFVHAKKLLMCERNVSTTRKSKFDWERERERE